MTQDRIPHGSLNLGIPLQQPESSASLILPELVPVFTNTTDEAYLWDTPDPGMSKLSLYSVNFLTSKTSYSFQQLLSVCRRIAAIVTRA